MCHFPSIGKRNMPSDVYLAAEFGDPIAAREEHEKTPVKAAAIPLKTSILL